MMRRDLPRSDPPGLLVLFRQPSRMLPFTLALLCALRHPRPRRPMSIRTMIFRVLLLGVSASCSAPASRAGTVDCSAEGAMTFICGIDAAEDSVAVPGTQWLIAS